MQKHRLVHSRMGNVPMTRLRRAWSFCVVLSLAAVSGSKSKPEALRQKLSWFPGDAATPVVTEPGRNILDNSSFEQGMGGWSTSGSDSCDREADEGTAWHGTRACRMYNLDEATGSLTIASPIFRAQEGRQYSLSCYARSTMPGTTLSLTMYNTQWAAQFSASAVLNQEWQRIQVTGTAGKTRRQTYFALVTVDGLRRGNDAWVDAVQAECGPVTPYRPSNELELGAVTGRFANVFYWGEPIVVRPIVSNWGEQPCRAVLKFSLHDYAGAEVRQGEMEIQASPGKGTYGELPLGDAWRGYGQAILDLTLPDQQGSLRYRCHIASVPKLLHLTLPRSPFFGVHGAGRFARNWELLEAIGCGTAKVYFGWSNEGPDKPCNFSGIDATVKALLRHQIEPIVCLGTWHPGWAERKNPDGTATGELDLEAWKRYISECVTHLKDVRLFESWNEVYSRGPTANTLELMWSAHEICKRLRPDAVMMTNPVAGVGCGDSFLKEFYRARRGRPLDAVSLHYPWDSWKENPEQGHMRDLLAATRRYAKQIAGSNPDLYITESGFHAGEGMHAQGMAVMESDGIEGIFCTPQQKADWMVQAFLIALQYEVGAHCEFDWCGYGQGPPWYSSLTYNDMSPTPSLAAYAVMTHVLCGARVVRAFAAGTTSARGLILEAGDDTITCLWSASGELTAPVEVTGPTGRKVKALQAMDVMGREQQVPLRAGVALMRLSEGPVFVRGAGLRLLPSVTLEHSASPWVEGKRYRVTCLVANPFHEAREFTLRIGTPENWLVVPPSRSLRLPARGRGTSTFQVCPVGEGRGVPFSAQCEVAGGVCTARATVAVTGAGSAARAEREPVITLADFEQQDLSQWGKHLPEGASLEIEPTTEVARTGTRSLRLAFTHGQPVGTWASAVLSFASPQKWSAYEGVAFWVYWTTHPACNLGVHLVEENGGTYFTQVSIGTAPGKWHQVVVPFRDLRFGAWSRDPNNRLNLDSIVRLALVGTASSGSSVLFVDDLKLGTSGTHETKQALVG